MSFRITVSACTVLGLMLVRLNIAQGTKIGDLSSRSHSVIGTVHILDHQKIMIVGFSYDGESRDARIYVGTNKNSLIPNGNDGIQLQCPDGSNEPLRRYKNENVTINIPKDLDTSDLRWLTIWSKKISQNFGDIMFQNLMYTDDSDNNTNNNDFEGDDDDYNSNPDAQDGHFAHGSGVRNVIPISFKALFATIISFSLRYIL